MLNFTETQTFKFGRLDLKEKLCLTAQNHRDGCWKIELDGHNYEDNKIYYLYLSKGNVVFSSVQNLSLRAVLKILQRYVPQLRTTNALKTIQETQAENSDNSILLLLSKLTLKTEIVNYQKFANAIKLQILDDFDRYLFDSCGQAEFVIDEELQNKRPIVGFKLDELIELAEQRKKQWQQIQPWLSADNAIVSCNQNTTWQNLNPQQQQRIKQLVGDNQTIEQITYNLGEDRLKVAQTLAQLAKKGLISFGNNVSSASSSPVASQSKAITSTAVANPISSAQKVQSAASEVTTHSAPEIIAVDDSPLLLKNFQTIVSGWGYRVRCCEDAAQAVEVMLAGEPSVIFLDLNMPKISGFQLMKQIRMQPELVSVPLVVLTAEKTMMNQQRAKWSKSRFLTKPLHPDQVKSFALELKAILQELAPISQ